MAQYGDLSDLDIDALAILKAHVKRQIRAYERSGWLSPQDEQNLRENRRMLKRINKEQARRIVQLPLF